MKRDKSELEVMAREHVSYEINMFFYTYHKLKEDKFKDTFEKNAILESFAIHTRNLTDFFYPPESTKADDCLAEHFLDYPDDFKKSKPWLHALIDVSKFRTGKEVAHITYHRLRVTPDEKKWYIFLVAKELTHVIEAFYVNLSTDKKLWFPKLPEL